MTKPPKPYTEGQLITLMKRAGRHIEDEELVDPGLGLGTEATRSGMIQTLKDRNYITVEKNVVQVTEKGKLLDTIVQGSVLAKPDLTAMWEKYLYEIGRGRKPAAPFIQRSKELAAKLVEDAVKQSEKWVVTPIPTATKGKGKKPLGPCPSCGKGIVDRKTFYGCLGYREGCRFTLPKTVLGKKISEPNVKRLLAGNITRTIKGFQSKKGTSFDASLKLVQGKLQFVFPDQKQLPKGDGRRKGAKGPT